jgi:hypothetical protein
MFNVFIWWHQGGGWWPVWFVRSDGVRGFFHADRDRAAALGKAEADGVADAFDGRVARVGEPIDKAEK